MNIRVQQRLSLGKHACAVALLFKISNTAAAQIPKRFAFFGGYSSRADIVFTPASSIPVWTPHVDWLNGWNVLRGETAAL
jgi:hypothetical protein